MTDEDPTEPREPLGPPQEPLSPPPEPIDPPRARRTGFSPRSRLAHREQDPESDQREPLSLAEELAEGDLIDDDVDERYEQIKQSGDTHIAELQRMSMSELIDEARKDNLADYAGMKKQDLIFKILKERVKLNGLMYGEGTLEILPDGFGFLRSPDYHYLSCPDDIYVSPSQIRRFGLRTGATVSGQIRPPKENERYFALLRVEAINYEDPACLPRKVFFDDLTPLHPTQRIVMEAPDADINTRVVDMIVPVGFGQRGLIVSPPRAGKTILMQKMAKAALANYPELLRLHAADRRAARGSHRHGAGGQGKELRSHQLDLRRAGRPPHPGLGDGHREGQADGGVRAGRDDLPGLDHPPGQSLELRMPALRQDPFRRRRRQRPAAAQAVLRRRPQDRGRRLADDRRHGPDRHRQQNGRGDLRGVQGHRQPGDRLGPPAGRQARSGRRSTSTAAAPARKKC